MPSVAMPSSLVPRNIGRLLHQQRLRTARALGHFHQPQRVRAVGSPDHDQPVAARGNGLHRLLAVGGGIADVFLPGAHDAGGSALSGWR